MLRHHRTAPTFPPTMLDDPTVDDPPNRPMHPSLKPWPSTVPDALEWRRVMKLRGRMPIELAAGDAALGRLIPTGSWGREYRADTADGAWRFVAERFWGTRFRAYSAGEGGQGDPGAVGAAEVVAEAERVGFRHRHLRVGDGPLLEWRQLGIQGRRYRLALPDNGPALLIVRNTGGSLRWRGTIELREPVRALGSVLPLLVLFSIFLVFSSNELGS